jgi:hypothetical protein
LRCALVLVCWLVACGDHEEDIARTHRDVLLLQAAFGADRSAVLMIDAEHAVSQRKPVHAAQMIESAVLPQLDAQIERVGAAQLSTVKVRKLQLRMVDAYKQRRAGLDLYRSVLATGSLDNMDVIEALRVQRDAEAALLALDRELTEMRSGEMPSDPR